VDDGAVVAVDELHRRIRICVELLRGESGQTGDRTADEFVTGWVKAVPEDDVRHSVDEPEQVVLPEPSSTAGRAPGADLSYGRGSHRAMGKDRPRSGIALSG